MKINHAPWYLKPILFFVPAKVNLIRDLKEDIYKLIEFKKFNGVIYIYKVEKFSEDEIKKGVIDDRVKQSTNNW